MRPLVAALLSAPILSGCFVVPEDADPGVGLELAVASKHIHRGMVQSERGVLQGGMTVDLPAEKVSDGLEAGAFDLRAWGNVDLSNSTGDAWFPDGHAGKFTEINFVGTYSQPLGPVTVDTGVFSYVLPQGQEFPFGARGETNEVFVTLSGEVLGAIPSISVRYDFDEVNSAYVIGSVYEEFALSDELQIFTRGWLGYSGAGMSGWNYGIRAAGFADLGGELGLEWFYDDRTTFEAKVSGTTILDDEIADWFDLIGIKDDNVWFTGGVRFAF